MKTNYFFYLIIFTILLSIIGCDQNVIEKLEANKNVVRQFSEAVNNNNLDALDDVVAANFLRHSQATPDVKINSLEEFKQFAKVSSESIPDMIGNIEIMVAEGDYVAVYATFTGTQTGQMGPFPAYNKKMESKTICCRSKP